MLTQIKQEKHNATIEMHQIKHDIFDVLVTIQGLLEIGMTDKALEIVQRITADLTEAYSYSQCKNETLNIILSIKLAQAKKLNVDLILNVKESAVLLVDDYDICRLLSNLLNNALHAVSHLPTEQRVIYFSIEISEHDFQIFGKNYYLQTLAPKAPDDAHGNGTKIIKKICCNYNGNYYTYTKNNIFFTETILRNKTLTPEF